MCAGRSLALLLALASAGTGCGAPTKTAGEVGHIFEGTGTSLQDKLSGLCGALGGRQAAPTLNGLDLDVDGCGDAGLAAQDYKELTSFQFLGIEGDIPDAEKEKVIRK